MDPKFSVSVLASTPNPQTLIYLSLHQCYSPNPVSICSPPDEKRSGEIAVERLLKGGRGHWSPLEAPQITFNACNFPHDVMQQATRHRVAVHFSVQSGRYCGQNVLACAKGTKSIEDVFYLRPTGNYKDRKGNSYEYTQARRESDRATCLALSKIYANKISEGFAEEHARALIPYCVRQNFVVSFNIRSLCHFLDLRSKKDAQIEIQNLSDMMFIHFKKWAPAIASFYEENRLGKARLAP